MQVSSGKIPKGGRELVVKFVSETLNNRRTTISRYFSLPFSTDAEHNKTLEPTVMEVAVVL